MAIQSAPPSSLRFAEWGSSHANRHSCRPVRWALRGRAARPSRGSRPWPLHPPGDISTSGKFDILANPRLPARTRVPPAVAGRTPGPAALDSRGAAVRASSEEPGSHWSCAARTAAAVLLTWKSIADGHLAVHAGTAHLAPSLDSSIRERNQGKGVRAACLTPKSLCFARARPPPGACSPQGAGRGGRRRRCPCPGA